MKKKIIFIILFFVLLTSLIVTLYQENADIETLSKYGSRGSEVSTIQEKLKRWGYYNGSVDGIAGQNTLAAMGITSNSSSGSSSSNSANLDLLARLIYGEARGEPYTGQVAVAAVVLNRVKNSSFPNTISGVIYQSCAFDVVAD